jgi:succinate-semialdehyde dehydrogenase/glutarate-semialdehyde dehydrogenase
MITMEAINPTTGQKIKTYERLDEQGVKKRIEQANDRYQTWRRTSFAERTGLMNKAAEVLEANKEEYARLMTREMGKAISEARSEVEKCAWVCRYYAEHAEKFLQDELIQTDASKSYVTFEPLGVVLAVMPWNFPFWQVFRFAAPNLMAGNTGLLKHASNVPGCAEAIEDVFRKAGFPEHVFTNLRIGSDQVAFVIDHPLVRAATLTGSDKAGRSVAEQSGRRLKKTVLELGGSDAYLILDDADLEHAAEVCKNSRLLNAGQSCIGAKRFIVVEEVYHSFMSLFLEKMRAAKMGDPMKEDIDLGPQAREDLRDLLHNQVQRSLDKGAELELGGKIPAGEGAFYPPTVLTNVRPGMAAFEEELFGPVAAVIKVKDEKEAIRMANASDFGLGAAVFTRDIKRGERIAARELKAGNCFVNNLVKSDPRLPFGGIKISGYGRELSHYGIREFVNIKTVWIN